MWTLALGVGAGLGWTAALSVDVLVLAVRLADQIEQGKQLLKILGMQDGCRESE